MGSGYSTDNNSHTMLPADLALDPYHFIYSSQELCKADSVMIPIWQMGKQRHKDVKEDCPRLDSPKWYESTLFAPKCCARHHVHSILLICDLCPSPLPSWLQNVNFQDSKSRCLLREHGLSLTLSINPITCHSVSWPRTSGYSDHPVLLCPTANVKEMCASCFPVLRLQTASTFLFPSSPIFQAAILQKHIS